MKNEDAFNAYLSLELRRLRPFTASIKMSEKFHIGVPDFSLIRRGQTAFFECKFLKEEPSPTKRGRVLGHPFGAAQLTFLRLMAAAGARCFGVIGLDYRRRMKVIHLDDLPASGNWTGAEWIAAKARFFDFSDVAGLADYLLGSGEVEGG